MEKITQLNRKTYRKRALWLMYLFLSFSVTLFAQGRKEIKGIVSDAAGETLIGVSVQVKNTTIGATTDIDGKFSVQATPWDTLVVSYLGYSKQEIGVGNQTELNIVLQENSETLQEVVITAWGLEKKTTLVGSVSTIKPKELKGPTSNLTTVLAGRVAGLISYQTSGEPGRDNAEFFVRGVSSFGGDGRSSTPLILINGIESTSSELARIQPDDIEAFSVLKDATATSMYGSRGANGVLLISTKRGEDGKTKFNVRYETSMSSNVREFNLADNITYMKLANEAVLTRDTKGDAQPVYSQKQIDRTIMGANPVIYPDNNWKDLMIKNYTLNHRANMNISGGTEKAKYYLSLSYKVDNGILKTHELNDFNSNVRNSTIEIRSNIDLKFTSTTDAAFRVSGLFNNNNGPATGTANNIFSSMLMANPVKFPAIYPQSYIPWAKHPLFGNSPNSPGILRADYYNPYAAMLSGYSQTDETAITAQFELNQDFKFITPGLKGRLMAYTKRNTSNNSIRNVSPYYYKAALDPEKKDVISELTCLNSDGENGGREWLNYTTGAKEVWSEDWLEMSGVYDKTIGIHAFTATALSYVRQKKLSGAASLERSLPQRNISLSGRATYSYDNRYLGEFNFGYNASERFNSKHRWGFFPSFGLAWNLAEEKFMQPAKKYIEKVKIRASYGIVGNDNLTDWINYDGERYFFLNQMYIAGSNNIYFGTENTKGYKQITVTRYGNDDITWERSYKSNLALELGLFRSLNVEFDAFHDKRTNILMIRTDLPESMGLLSIVRANIGEMVSRGFETTVDYNKTINKNVWISARGTLTYSTNKTTKYEEPEYPENMQYLSHIGDNWNVPRGLIAERLFTDEYEVANSPEQFGSYMAGDIKYRDVNGDGKITEDDYVSLGYPTIPELVYGFGFSVGYKDFDLSAFFSGQDRVSMTVGAAYITPFVPRSGGQETGLLKVIANDHWSEDNRNPYAFFPRLSAYTVENNTKPSSWWIRDGSFIRLKTVELGYEPKGKWVKRHGLMGFRIYINGMNLLTFSKFKLWDVEMKGNGLGYPLQRVFNAGIQLNF